MAKKQKDMHKEMMDVLSNMKDNMKKLGDETKIWAKRGEKELGRLSAMGKLEISIVGMQMKREKILRSIGERFVNTVSPDEIADSKLKALCKEFKALDSSSKKKKTEMKRVGKELFKK
jgi:hypothetical protein